MRTFKFRLASVLRFRERVKEEKQWELQSILAERQRAEEEIARLEREWQNTGEAVAAEAARVFTGIDLRLYSDYAVLLTRRIDEKRRMLEKLDEHVAAKRQELLEASRDVKTLEQLRGRLEQNYRNEQDAVEQKAMDEAGQRKFTKPPTGKKVPR